MRRRHRTPKNDLAIGEILQACLARSGASDAEIDILLQHLCPESLLVLRQTGHPADAAREPNKAKISKAIEDEITKAPARLMHDLTAAVAKSPSLDVKNGNVLADAGQSVGSDLERIAGRKNRILNHCVAFGLPVPADIRETIDAAGTEHRGGPRTWAEPPVEQTSKLLQSAGSILKEIEVQSIRDHRDRQLDGLRAKAVASLESLFTGLAAPTRERRTDGGKSEGLHGLHRRGPGIHQGVASERRHRAWFRAHRQNDP